MPLVETRHARCGNADALHQQQDGRHEVVVVQERLAHAHEDQVDAVFADLHAVPVQHGGDLSCDLARGQVAPDAELCRQAELAVDRAAHLRRDADGGTSVPCLGQCTPIPLVDAFVDLLRRGAIGAAVVRVLGIVGVFDAVAVRHPDGFNGLAVSHAHQVALGAVDGNGGLHHLRQADGVLCRERRAQLRRKRGDAVDRCHTLAVQRVPQLAGAVRLLTQRERQFGQFRQRFTKKCGHLLQDTGLCARCGQMTTAQKLESNQHEEFLF